MTEPARHRLTGPRVAILSMAVSGALAVAKVVLGYLAGSTSVVADGMESASDVVASAAVLFGLALAARPADAEHPYGHGRIETLTGLGLGLILAVTGLAICIRSLDRIEEVHPPPAAWAIWPLIASIGAKSFLSVFKFRTGRRIHSEALIADAWNDSVDILSGFTAIAALTLTLYDPSRFLAADHYGGFAVGLIVIFLGLRVVRDTSLQLMDTMPDEDTMRRIRQVAQTVPGALAVEKCFARKTGLKYHVDLHLEVEPEMTVRQSHDIATQVRIRIIHELDCVADVLVHVEPFSGPTPDTYGRATEPRPSGSGPRPQ
ncbi:MAG: cation diffusion facilitator family transporter [Bryobacteraceae bacterium]|nr:cation diffusion facilitator family transporter [Bryobacteraceae bacterium]